MTGRTEHIKRGDIDEAGETVVKVLSYGPEHVIYETEGASIKWKTASPELAKMIIEIGPDRLEIIALAEGNRSFKKIADHAILRAMEFCTQGDLQGARETLKIAKQKLGSLRNIVGRLYYLLSCIIVVLVNALVVLLLSTIGPP